MKLVLRRQLLLGQENQVLSEQRTDYDDAVLQIASRSGTSSTHPSKTTTLSLGGPTGSFRFDASQQSTSAGRKRHVANRIVPRRKSLQAIRVWLK